MLDFRSSNIWIEINSKKKIELAHVIFLSAFFIFLINSILKTTMFNVYINNYISELINIFTICMLMFKIVLCDRYTLKNILTISLLGIVSITIYKSSSYASLVYLAIFIIAAKNIEFEKIVKMYLYVKVVITIVAIIACKFGIIEHIIYIRDDKYRYSFGSIYATDFAAGIFFIILAYVYIKFRTLNFKDVILFISLGIFTNYYCDARVDSICIFIVSVSSFYFIIKRKYQKKNIFTINNRIIKILLILSIPICALISLYITNNYNANSDIMRDINELLSNRLSMGKIVVDDYGFKLFGQKIEMIGYGGSNIKPDNYYFVDSSYVYIGLRYGLVILLLICILYVLHINKVIKKGDIILPFIIAFIGINSIVAHHFIDIAYNPFLLMFFSKSSCISQVINKSNGAVALADKKIR